MPGIHRPGGVPRRAAPGWRDAWLPWIAPALLVSLALCQLVLVRTDHLSPWKGGGFGMFSTNDHGGFRIVRAFAQARDRRAPLPLPSRLDPARARVRELPSRARLLGLARSLRSAAPPDAAIRVEVWRTEFVGQRLRPAAQRIAGAVLEPGP